MSAKSVLRAAIEGEELVVRIGVDTLCFAIEQGNGIEPGCKIKDRAAFLTWFAAHLIESDTDEAGASGIERVFDNLAVDAVEGAQDFMHDPDSEPHLRRDGQHG